MDDNELKFVGPIEIKELEPRSLLDILTNKVRGFIDSGRSRTKSVLRSSKAPQASSETPQHSDIVLVLGSGPDQIVCPHLDPNSQAYAMLKAYFSLMDQSKQ